MFTQHTTALGSILSTTQIGVVVHIWNPNIWEEHQEFGVILTTYQVQS